MTPESVESMARHFRQQARFCTELGSPMYGELLDRAADDIDAGGPIARLLVGHERDPGPSALALRLFGSVHRLVLERRAGALAAFYPSVGGRWDLAGAWPALVDLLARQPEAAREWLDRAPQTNEVGRSTALMGGLLHIGENHRLPVRLFEIGASGALNLHAQRFRYEHEAGFGYGPSDSPVQFDRAWAGAALPDWPDLKIVERQGCDSSPVDVTTTAGRLTLTAYVWPDQGARLDRLRAAFGVAASDPVKVRRQDAASFVERLELMPGTTTVLWHSVMWQYLSDQDQARISTRLQTLGERASDEMPLAHLSVEQTRRTPGADHEFLVALRTWPGGLQRVLGVSTPHGIPTTWE